MGVNKVAFLAVTFVLRTAIVRGNVQHALSPPYTCTTTTTMCQPGGTSDNNQPVSVNAPASQGRPGKRGEIGPNGMKGEKGDPCQCDVADEDAMEEVRRKMENLEAENLDMKEKMNDLQNAMFPTNCSEATKLNGTDVLTRTQIYPLKAIADYTPYIVTCPWDGWIVIQRRSDGVVNFYRDWESYAKGFGDRNGEFWLGLRAIHRLTSEENYKKLRIDLRSKDGSVKYAEYSSFSVGDEDSGFLLDISGYSGNAVDKMNFHHGSRFTTKDRDLDSYSGNCAHKWVGAWWYKACYHSNLNGRYNDHFMWPQGTLLVFSEMKIRPV